MEPTTQPSPRTAPAVVPVEDLRPGDIIGATGARTVVSHGTGHGTYRSFVVRYSNGEHRIEAWDTGTTVTVVGRNGDVRRQGRRLKAVP